MELYIDSSAAIYCQSPTVGGNSRHRGRLADDMLVWLWDDSCSSLDCRIKTIRALEWEDEHWMLRTLFYWLILAANKWLEVHSKLTRPANITPELIGDVHDENQVTCIKFSLFVYLAQSGIKSEQTFIGLLCTNCLNAASKIVHEILQ